MFAQRINCVTFVYSIIQIDMKKNNTIIEEIVLAMHSKGMTQQQLSELTGISRMTISRILHNKNWNRDLMIRILEVLDLGEHVKLLK